VARKVEKLNIYKQASVGKTEEKRQFGRPKRRWEDK